MKMIIIALASIVSFSASAGQIIDRTGYVKIAETGTYKGQYIFAKSLKRVQVGIDSVGPLPNDVELLEICEWDEFKTKDPVAVVLMMNIASIDETPIKVSYFDNGHPLAGMCVEKVELFQ